MQNSMILKRIIVLFFVAFASAVLTAANEYRLVIDIPSYNNKDWCIKNLQSVLDQVGHTNYTAIVTDDCSPDGTGTILEQFIKGLPQEQQDHVKLIQNKHRRGALANHYHVIQLATDDDVVVQLDGDDFFKTTDVFTYINDLYKNQDVWWTYGVYENWPDASMKTFSRPLTEEDGVTRATVPFVFGPVRSYRGWFAKQIKLQDLIADFEPCLGKFYGSAGDFALMFPLLEMASSEHLYYINKVLYTRNVATPINDFKVNKNLQERCARAVKDSPRYSPISSFAARKTENVSASVIVFDLQRDVRQLEQCLASVSAHVRNYKQIHVFYDSKGLACLAEYEAFVKANNQIHWVDFAKIPSKQTIQTVFRKSFADYFFMLNSSAIVEKDIDLKASIDVLKNTHAYTFAFGLNIDPEKEKHEWLDDDLYVWKFSVARGALKEHGFHGNLYRFNDVMAVVRQAKRNALEDFVAQWEHARTDPRKVGLYVFPGRVVIG
jgi:glycosyltransferase involved in cell wall biosynthesis